VPAHPVASGDGPRVARVDAAPPPEPSRHAWFDLNGDGRIQDWGTLYGGDAYLAWNPPGGSAATPGVRPAARDAHPARGETPPPPAEVELRQARDAYARYGNLDAAAPTAA
jgi:hypothetical protein